MPGPARPEYQPSDAKVGVHADSLEGIHLLMYVRQWTRAPIERNPSRGSILYVSRKGVGLLYTPRSAIGRADLIVKHAYGEDNASQILESAPSFSQYQPGKDGAYLTG